MNVTDKLYTEWAWRSKTGTPSMDNPEDKAILDKLILELITEEEKDDTSNLVNKLIKVIKTSNLSPNELNTYIRSISNRGLKGDLKSKLANKGFTSSSFKVGDKAVEYVIDKIADSEAEEFVNYKPKSFSSIPPKGNFLKVTGMSNNLFRSLYDIEPGADAGGNAIGKGELFLALSFSDIDNRGGAGDLNYKNQNLEVKGTAGRLGGQGRGGSGASNFYLGNLGDRFLEGEELEDFVNEPANTNINYGIKNLYDRVKAKGGDTKAVINTVVNVLDNLYFNAGKAKTYFGSSSDYSDLKQMKNNLLKLNAASYATKTNVGYIIFVNSSTGDYSLIPVNDLDDSIDSGAITTGKKSPTVNPTLGYKWHNPHPSLVIGN